VVINNACEVDILLLAVTITSLVIYGLHLSSTVK